MSGFQFMPHIFDMISSSPQANMNLDYNLWNTQLNRDSIMYMGSGFQASAFLDYPAFGIFGNNLLNPNLAIGQVMNSFGNCKFNNNWGDMFKFNNGFNLNNTSPFGPTSPSNNGASAARQVKQDEYDKLKKILTAYRDNNNLSTGMKAKINEAINKSGKVEEKIDALKSVIKTLDAKKLQNVILSDKDNVLGKLDDCGYNTSSPEKLKSDDTDNKLKNELRPIKQDLDKTPAQFGRISTFMSQSSYDDILRTISFWNDENDNIIKCVSNALPNNDKELTPAKGAVENVVNSLLNKSDSIQSKYTSNFENLKAAHKEVEDAYQKVQSNFNKANLNILADKFDKLYAILRLTVATAVGAEIKNNYQKVLNDATGKTIIPDDFIVAETKADLQKEHISIPTVDVIKESIIDEDYSVATDIDAKDTVEEKIEALKGDEGNKAIVETAKKGVYKSTAASSLEKPHFYIAQNDKILELKDVIAVDANGNCTMKDGSKKSLKDAKKNTTEVNPSDIMQYNTTLERVEKLTKDGADKRLKVCTGKLNGNTVYASVGKDLNKIPQYFIVKDGKLMQIKCEFIDKKGNIHTDAGVKTFAQLTDSDFTEVNDSDILKEDEEEATPSDVQDLLSNNALRETNCKNPMVYYSNKTKKHYIVKGGVLKELKDVKQVFGNGVAKMNNNKNYKISSVKLQDVDMSQLKTEEQQTKESTNNTSVDKPSEAGKVLRQRLRRNTSSADYDVVDKKINEFSKYTSSEDIIGFIEGYYDEHANDWGVNWNSELCAQISSENDYDTSKKEKALKTIAQQILKVMDELGISKDSQDYTDMKYYADNGPKRQNGTKWRTWSFWSSKRTGVANNMDDIIERVLKQYREKHPKQEETTQENS